MPGSGDDADGVEGDHPRILKFRLNFGERLHRMRRQAHAGKAQVVSMLHDVDESDDAGPAMCGVEPIASPRVIGDVALALIPDPKAVEAVVGDRNPDEEQLQQKNEGQAAGSGSDAFAMATRAEDHGDHFLLNGRKLWITNASEAGFFLLFANANPEAGYKGVT